MKKHFFFIFLITILCSIPLLDLLNPGLPLTHDGADHVARIANFYQNLQEGNVVPRWAGNLNWGYGHPILMFLYPLPSYGVSVFHVVGFSFVDSTKLVFGAAYVLSAIAMYVWLQAFLDKKSALIGAFAYTLAPYRFVDLYVRGAIGEHVAFIFPPLICYSLYTLASSKTKRGVILGSLSVAGLLLSHNALSLMFLPLLFLYAVYLFKTVREKFSFLFFSFAFFLWGFALAAFFWIPAFFEGKYTLRDIVTRNEYLSRFETWERFFYSPWNYGGTGQFSVEVGIIQWVGIALAFIAVFLYWKRKNHLWALCLGALVFLFLSLFLMTNESLFVWQEVTILQKFQFPWRLLSVVVFLSALLLGLLVHILREKQRIILSSGLVMLLFLFSMGFWHAKSYLAQQESYFTSIYNGTTDTGESAPIWSVRFMEHRPTSQMEVIEGRADILSLKRTSTVHTYEITAKSRSRLRENTLYFPGWIVVVDNKPAGIEFQDPRHRGLMTFFVNEGKHRVEVRFTETKLRMVSDTLSVLAFAAIICLTFYFYILRSTKE
ncbi:MAG: hypothetical protein HYV40_03705 [Candidatus Levybacteria bacterium]|nr:hypothetical protein [Candidatus Levybacteria bacterium]